MIQVSLNYQTFDKCHSLKLNMEFQELKVEQKYICHIQTKLQSEMDIQTTENKEEMF